MGFQFGNKLQEIVIPEDSIASVFTVQIFGKSLDLPEYRIIISVGVESVVPCDQGHIAIQSRAQPADMSAHSLENI